VTQAQTAQLFALLQLPLLSPNSGPLSAQSGPVNTNQSTSPHGPPRTCRHSPKRRSMDEEGLPRSTEGGGTRHYTWSNTLVTTRKNGWEKRTYSTA
jgi:hypothetical protein